LKELWKLRKKGELASSWLRERGITMEGSIWKGSKGVSIEFK
jgi:hypothetical protein